MNGYIGVGHTSSTAGPSMLSAFFEGRTSKHRTAHITAIWGLPVVAAIGVKTSARIAGRFDSHDESSIQGDNRIVRDARPGSDSGFHAPAVERRARAPEHLKTNGSHSRHYRSTTAGPSNRDRASWSLRWRGRAYRPLAPEHDHRNPPATHPKGSSSTRARSTRHSTHPAAFSSRSEGFRCGVDSDRLNQPSHARLRVSPWIACVMLGKCLLRWRTR